MIVHLQGDDVNPSVDKDWYGWAPNRFCDLGSHLVSCGCQYPKMVGAFFLHCALNIHVEFIEVVQKLSAFLSYGAR